VRRSKNNPHYSYSIYADSATAERFDDSHFGGPIGQLIVEMQERVLFDFLGDVHNASVLDIGTGTGRAALAIAKRGAHVTGVDASAEMLKVAQKHAEDANLDIKFLRGDAHSLDFPDRSCDVAVSLRMLMHTPDWRRCIAEMCRVARQRVIFDYPPSISFAALQTITRKAAQLAGRRVEAYHVIRTGSVRSALHSNGFEITKSHRQFVLPIVFHKLIASPRFTANAERTFAVMGLLRLMGSPVTILAERRG
jgi:ubiquinone/menaquinone biosynthesis C-methylase UbiE